MTSRRISIRPQAVRDLDKQMAYIALHTSKTMAHRFERMFKATLEKIEEAPESGSPWESDLESLGGMRFRIMKRFRRHIVFYRFSDDVIDVIRILHSAQNLEQSLQDVAE